MRPTESESRRLAWRTGSAGVTAGQELRLAALVFIGMRANVKLFRRKAAECERLAVLVADPKLRSTYQDLAVQWRQMAEQLEELEGRTTGRQ
jgi:hypothetical protein